MVRILALASVAVLASTANAFTVTIKNSCSGDIELYTRLASVYTDECETITPGGSIDKTIEKGYEGHFRNGTNDAATLIEFATMGDMDLAWFDIGIIPPHLNAGFEFCSSLQECMEHSASGIGFNTPVEVKPLSNTGKDTCETITCLQNGCEDAYNFPKDDTKTHSCAFGTDFEVTFCPSGDSNTEQQTTQEETPATETPSPVTTETTAPATTETPAPVTTEVPAADSPVQEEAGEVHTQNDDVNGESETTAPDVIQAETPAPEVETPAPEVETPAPEVETPAPTTVAPEVIPEATPSAAKSKFCV